MLNHIKLKVIRVSFTRSCSTYDLILRIYSSYLYLEEVTQIGSWQADGISERVGRQAGKRQVFSYTGSATDWKV